MYFGIFRGDFASYNNLYVNEAATEKKVENLKCCSCFTECITVASEEGQYFFKGDTGGEVCGLYLLTDPDRRVHLSIDYLDIPCSQGGLVSVSV